MPDRKPASLKALDIEPRRGSNYPPDLARKVAGRDKRALGDPFGLDQFGVNHTTLAPGSASAIRHYHRREDEFIYVLEGEITLHNDDGEHLLTAGMCAGFKAGERNAHRLVNKSSRPATYLEIGTRSAEEDVTYPDDDLKAVKTGGKYSFTRKDGKALQRG